MKAATDSMRAKIGLTVLALVCCIVLLLAGVTLWAIRDPRTLVERLVFYKTGRVLSIGELHVSFGDPLIVDMDDAHFANAEWGSEPDMFRAGHIMAEIDRHSIFAGPLKLNRLVLDDAALFLERDPGGKGNWKFGNHGRSHPGAPNGPGPGRTTLPTIARLTIANSRIAMRTSGGNMIKINFETLNLEAPSVDAPVLMNVEGSYNDIPARLNIETDSFTVFRQADQPFGIKVAGDAAAMSMMLQGHMIDPLNFDRVEANLRVDSKRLGRTAALFNAGFDGNIPLRFSSSLTRNGDVWQFGHVEGALAGNPIESGEAGLTEGARRQPDNVRFALNFADFNVGSVLPEKPGDEPFSFTALDKNPGTLFDAQITARKIAAAWFDLQNVKFHAGLTAGRASIDDLSSHLFNGRMGGSISATAQEKGNRVIIHTILAGADAAQLVRAVGGNEETVNAAFDADFMLEARGETLMDFKASSEGYAALAIKGGAISSRMVRLASLDWQAFFQKPTEFVPLDCAVALLDIKKGTGRFSPLRIDTAAGRITGTGQIDFTKDTLDMAFQTDKESTGPLALDKPIHVTGSFDKPDVVPALLSTTEIRDYVTLEPKNQLAPDLQKMLAENPCYR